jgi:hypothetical protein
VSDAPSLPPNDKDDELLDALVRRACRGQADPQGLERLARMWHREMSRKRRPRAWVPLAAAACLAAVAGTLALSSLWPRDVVHRPAERGPRGSENAVDATQRGIAPPSPPNHAAPAAGGSEGPGSGEREDVPSETDEPTAYERLLARAALQRKAASIDRDVLAVRRRLVEQLTNLEVEAIDDQTAEELTAELGVSKAELERELARLSLALRDPRREKAIELFGRVATSGESTPSLLQLWRQGLFQAYVAPALARLADAPTLAACYAQATAPHVRTVLAAGLVGRLGHGDGRLLLNVLAHCRHPEELLAAVRKANGPLTEALFAELNADSRAVRYAAARALGALNEPEVTRRLIEHVVSGNRRQEALVALAGSREPLAIAFLSQAKENAVLATALQSALVQSSTSLQWYGG